MLEKENEQLIKFWDSFFEGQEPQAIQGKWIEDETFNSMINKYIKEGFSVLDYGTGSGWALFEIARTVKIGSGLGVDTSENAIRYCKECAALSGDTNLEFIAGDESILHEYDERFDVVVSFNVVDVLPLGIVRSILSNLKSSLKPGGVALIGINPDFPKEFLEKIGFTEKGGYLYKDGILRANTLTTDGWMSLFKEFFDVVESTTFSLVEREKQYPRRLFVLHKRLKHG